LLELQQSTQAASLLELKWTHRITISQRIVFLEKLMMETKVWPTLYSKGSKGEIRVWDISVEGNNVIISHGVKGGKIVTKVTQSFGKNRGKKNETSDHAQALADSQSKFDKQLKRDYYPTEK